VRWLNRIYQLAAHRERDDTVRICNGAHREIACGLTRYSVVSLEQIVGRRLEEIAATFGCENRSEIVHGDDLVVL